MKKELWEIYRKPEWRMREWSDSDHKPLYTPCRRGFCLYEQVVDAMMPSRNSWTSDLIALVEVEGQCFKRVREHLFLGSSRQSARQWWQKKRILKLYKWTKEDAVGLAVFAARMAIGVYEKRYPNDKWHRGAIEAADQWLRDKSAPARRAAKRAAISAMEEEIREKNKTKIKWNRSIQRARSAAVSAQSAAWSAANGNIISAIGVGMNSVIFAIQSSASKCKTARKCEEWIQKRLKKKETRKK